MNISSGGSVWQPCPGQVSGGFAVDGGVGEDLAPDPALAASSRDALQGSSSRRVQIWSQLSLGWEVTIFLGFVP